MSEQSPKKEIAETMLSLPQTAISSLVLNENLNVGIKKFKLGQHKLLAHVEFLLLNCNVVSISFGLQKKALDIHFKYKFSYYDSLILAAALEAGCITLYSEDLQHGKSLRTNSLSSILSFEFWYKGFVTSAHPDCLKRKNIFTT
jgi:predicted nucleic acid-binding protein